MIRIDKQVIITVVNAAYNELLIAISERRNDAPRKHIASCPKTGLCDIRPVVAEFNNIPLGINPTHDWLKRRILPLCSRHV